MDNTQERKKILFISSEMRPFLDGETPLAEIARYLPQKIQEDYTNIWNEFLVRDTPESKLVHELDKLEMALQAKIYENDVDPEKVKPFIISAVEQIIDPDVKKTLIDILK